jgi:hypothetical protein
MNSCAFISLAEREFALFRRNSGVAAQDSFNTHHLTDSSTHDGNIDAAPWY